MEKTTQSAYIFRRLGAFVYDLLAITALIMAGTALLLPLTHGEAITEYRHLYQLYLFFIIALFYIWFWQKGGQTIGMKAWRLRVVDAHHNQAINLSQATIRFFAGLISLGTMGLGLLFAIFARSKQPFYDNIAQTKVIHLPKKAD